MSCCRRPTETNIAQLGLKRKSHTLDMYDAMCWPHGVQRRSELNCCVAECGREEGYQGGVEPHLWRATRVLFRTEMCVHAFPVSHIVRISVYCTVYILLHDYECQPASKAE